ncbi:MAG: M20/M25/M40 family metallo-hydrolase, partial [Tateyamaria sp.]
MTRPCGTPGKNTGGCVHFNSHHNVVEVDTGWARDPFCAEVEDGKIYGPGSCYMKGDLAASLIAAEALIEEHPDFAGATEISATADEKSRGYGGVAYLAEQADDYTGLRTHCVPDSCRIVIDRRFLVEEDVKDVRNEVVALLDNLKATRDRFDDDLREMNLVLPSMTDKSAPVVETIHAVISDVLGIEPTYVASPGSYDQKHIGRISKLRNCIAYWSGELELAHKP